MIFETSFVKKKRHEWVKNYNLFMHTDRSICDIKKVYSRKKNTIDLFLMHIL